MYLKRYLITIFFLTLILPTLCYASDSQYNLTLKEAREAVIKNSSELAMAAVNLKLSELAENDARSTYEHALNSYSSTGGNSNLKEPMIAAKKAYDTASHVVEDTKISINQLKDKLIYDIERKYLSILDLKDNISIQEESHRQLLNTIRIERLKLDIGLTTKIVIDQYLQQAQKSEELLNTLYNNECLAIWDFNRMIGRELNVSLNLTPVVFTEIELNGFDVTLDKTTDNYLELEKVKQSIIDKGKYINFYVNEGTDKIEKYEVEIKQNELKKNDIEYSLRIAIQEKFNNLRNVQKKLTDSKSNYITTQINYTQKELQYNLGIISRIALEAEKNNLNIAQMTYIKETYNYYLAARELQLAEKGILVKGNI